MAFTGPTSSRLFFGIWIAESCITVLPVCDVSTAVTNIYWPTHANAAIFVHHVITKWTEKKQER